MAKAAKITGLTSQMPAVNGLRQILAVRVDELWSWGGLICGPENASELHNMRIAAKRLRYCLEFFAPLLGASAAPVQAKFKRLQDLLGEIHDCDVWAEMLEKLQRKDRKRKGGADEAGELASEADCLLEELAVRRGQLFCSFAEYWNGLSAQGFKADLLALADSTKVGGGGTDGS